MHLDVRYIVPFCLMRFLMVRPCVPPSILSCALCRQMWIHSDVNAIMPKCRVWLEGALAYRAGKEGSEAVLVSHPASCSGGPSIHTIHRQIVHN